MKNTKKHFLINVLEWAEKRQEGFTKDDLLESKKYKIWEKEILNEYFKIAVENQDRKRGGAGFAYLPETIFYVIATNPGYKFVLTSDALFKYIDYQELKLATKTATEARELAGRSIIIAIAAILVSALIPVLVSIFLSQTVKFDRDQVYLIQMEIRGIIN